MTATPSSYGLDLIHAAQRVVTSFEQDRHVRGADVNGLAAALDAITNPGGPYSDLTGHAQALASVGIDPMTAVLAAIRHLRNQPGVTGLVEAKAIVDEMNTRTVAHHATTTGICDPEALAAEFGIYVGHKYVQGALFRVLGDAARGTGR